MRSRVDGWPRCRHGHGHGHAPFNLFVTLRTYSSSSCLQILLQTVLFSTFSNHAIMKLSAASKIPSSLLSHWSPSPTSFLSQLSTPPHGNFTAIRFTHRGRRA